jgi:hypothetical protein
LEACGGAGEFLVVREAAIDEGVEGGVSEEAPPGLGFGLGFRRLAFPADAAIGERGGEVHGRCLVVRADGLAGGEEQQGKHGRKRSQIQEWEARGHGMRHENTIPLACKWLLAKIGMCPPFV